MYPWAYRLIAPARIRVRRTFLDAFDLKLRKAKRGKLQRERPGPASNESERGAALRIALGADLEHGQMQLRDAASEGGWIQAAPPQ